MIPTIYKKISWLQSNPTILKKIFRGIERETLRTTKYGEIINKHHPYNTLGSSLTHKWITTDFSESLLEFITPTHININYTLKFLQDIHKFVQNNLNKEYFWPLSIPPYIKSINSILLAKYGTSNIGKLKTLYRKGLQNRYGTLMNIISGVHYNFSFSNNFWNLWIKIKNIKNSKSNSISKGYLCLIRNYHRYGWIIPYLFGASPAIESFFLKNKQNIYNLKKHKKILYLPWSTSLRLSNLGHTNLTINKLSLTFNSLSEYLSTLKYFMHTSSKNFENIGMYDNEGNLKQINTNLLQIENELYTYIRPKPKFKKNEKLSVTLKKKGIQYIEIRTLDINPFSCIGIEKNQILLLDLFLIWCILIESPKICQNELKSLIENWNIVILKGRKPQQKINIYTYNCKKTIETIGKNLFQDFFYIAEILDYQSKTNNYQKACNQLINYFDHPELTYSEKILNHFINFGIHETGMILSSKNKKKINRTPFKKMSNKKLKNEVLQSKINQKIIETEDKLNFEQYLNLYYNTNF
ncbi:MAG: glutamate--cysteine ligase [Buchnera aphidicola (Chaetogeoica yunlongensis)]